MTPKTQLLASILAVVSLAGCAPMDTREQQNYDHPGEHQQYDRNDYRNGQDYRPGADYRDDREHQPGQLQSDQQSGAYRNDGSADPSCNSCGVVHSITQVAGGSAADHLPHDRQYDLYRIDVHMISGDKYSFDQQDHEELREGMPVEVRDGHVYPQLRAEGVAAGKMEDTPSSDGS